MADMQTEEEDSRPAEQVGWDQVVQDLVGHVSPVSSSYLLPSKQTFLLKESLLLYCRNE